MRFIFLCALWYASSALSSNTGKAILNEFRYPVTLTFVQFGFVAAILHALHVPYYSVFPDAPPDPSYIEGYATDGLLSGWRSHLFEHGYITDSCQHNAHHQGKRPSAPVPQ
jgi:hypothetical protein